jgi:hypothetical protein
MAQMIPVAGMFNEQPCPFTVQLCLVSTQKKPIGRKRRQVLTFSQQRFYKDFMLRRHAANHRPEPADCPAPARCLRFAIACKIEE